MTPPSELSELLAAIAKLATIEEAACRVADCWLRFRGVNPGNVVKLGELEADFFPALDDLERATQWSKDLRKETL